jgi:hypothetical protein
VIVWDGTDISRLRQMGAGKASFVSPEIIDGQIAEQIVNWGWDDA